MPCGRFYGLSVGEERIHFHRAEIPVRQHSHGLPGLELWPRVVFARRGDPQPGDGARRGSFVDSDSEGRTAEPARRAIARAQAPTASRSNVIAWRTQRGMCRCYGPQFNYADSGLWMIPLQSAGLLDIRETTACRPGGSATQAARRRHGPSAASPVSSSPQSRRLRRDLPTCPARP
jgi:hypothetical protein